MTKFKCIAVLLLLTCGLYGVGAWGVAAQAEAPQDDPQLDAFLLDLGFSQELVDAMPAVQKDLIREHTENRRQEAEDALEDYERPGSTS